MGIQDNGCKREWRLKKLIRGGELRRWKTSDTMKGTEKERAESRPYTAFFKNIEGNGALYNMAVPHPPSPVLHIHRDLAPAPIRIL